MATFRHFPKLAFGSLRDGICQSIAVLALQVGQNVLNLWQMIILSVGLAKVAGLWFAEQS